MEGERLQADMDGHAALPDDLLRFVGNLPVGSGRGSEEDLRKGRGVLPETHVLQSVILCFRFLRNDSNEQMVEPVHNDTVA